jgi:hypothetical protein
MVSSVSAAVRCGMVSSLRVKPREDRMLRILP